MGLKDCKLQLNHNNGGGSEDRKTGDWTSARFKQVAMAKLDLNKTQTVCGGYGEI
jgi:hypothetical protein